MFHWTNKKISVLLTDDEEMGLVNELSGNDLLEIIRYDSNQDTRKKYEKLISTHLLHLCQQDTDGFYKKYVFRSLCDTDAQSFFPSCLRFYGSITKLATFGKFVSESENDITGVKALLEDFFEEEEENPIFYITFVNRKLLPWPHYTYKNYISFPAKTIKNFVGTVTNFSLITDKIVFNFKEKRVSINIIR